MKTVTIDVNTIDRMILDLEQAVLVCYNVDYESDETERSPSYATGYSRATMQMAIQQLQYLKSSENKS